MIQIRVALAAMAATLFIGGCAVTAVPVTTEELENQSRSDLAEIFSDQAAIEAPITLHEAMARALKYNLNQRLKLMEEALASGELDVMRYDLLPELTISAGYNYRNNEPGASSESLITGTTSLEPSKSIEPRYWDGSAIMTWNLLDFGVSYVRNQQQANEVLVMRERTRKVIQNVIQDVRYAYWKAVSAQRLLPEMDDLLEQAEDALENSKQLENLRLQDPLKPLRYQKSLLDLIGRLWRLREDLSSARTELAALINVRPGTYFELADDEDNLIDDALPIYTPVSELEELALVQRPELIEENYKRRISVLEVRKAMLSMFPGLEFSFGKQHQQNKYLWNETWTAAGAGITWNIFNLLSGPARMEQAEMQGELDDIRRMALSMSVLTQVQLAYQRYHLAIKNNQIAVQQSEVESRIKKHIISGQIASREHALAVLSAKTGALVARMKRHVAHAEVQNAMGRLQNSIGYDPLPGEVTDYSIDSLAQTIKARLEQAPVKL
jgi:outer membrane protein TolC